MEYNVLKSVAFFGHRILRCDREKLKKELNILIENMVLQGCDCYYFGGYGQFDELSYEVVSGLKERYPSIIRVYVRPYYEELPKAIENIYLQSYEKCEYFKNSARGKYQIIGRNFCMVDYCDMCVFYVGERGGAKLVLDYAIKKKKKYINLY